jgi:MFS family permease
MADHRNEAADTAAAYAKVDRRIIPFLFLCYLLAYLDRVNVGFAKLQMAHDLGLSDAAFATGAGIFFIGYFFFEVPSNLLLYRFGARRWIARIMIGWGLVSAAMVFVHDEWTFYAMRFALGLAEAGFFPGVIFYLTLWYPSNRRASRMAWFASAIAVAGVIGNPLSGAIMQLLSGWQGLAGWQWLFVLEGAPSVLVGFWAMRRLDSSIGEASRLTQAEKRLLTAALAEEEQLTSRHRLRDALGCPALYGLCAVYFTVTIGLYGLTFWLPTIVGALGFEGFATVGLVLAIPNGAAIVAMVLACRRADRSGAHRVYCAGSMAMGALGLTLCGLFPASPALGVVFIALGSAGVMTTIPLFWPIPAAMLAGSAAAGGIGLINAVGNLGGYVGPNLPVWVRLAVDTPAAPLFAIAILLLSGAALLLALSGAAAPLRRLAAGRTEARRA